MQGCDIACSWCDSKEAWKLKKDPDTSLIQIQNQIQNFNAKTIIVTGGEPFNFDLTELTTHFHKKKYKLHVETSGTEKLSGNWDWISFSPKKQTKINEHFYKIANELKIIIDSNDFKWAEENKKKINKDAKLYLQVEWSKKKELLPIIIDYIKSNPEWNLSVQMHKYLDIP